MRLALLVGIFLVSFIVIVVGIGLSGFHPSWVAGICVWLALALIAAVAVLISGKP